MSAHDEPERRQYLIDSPYSAWRMTLTVAVPVAALVGALLSGKTVQIGPVLTGGGVVLFPLTFSLLAAVAEVYGVRAGMTLATICTGAIVVTVAAFGVVLWLPAATIRTDQNEAFQLLYGQGVVVLVAAVLSFAAGYFAAVLALYAVAQHTKGQLMALRLWVAPTLAQVAAVTVGLPIAYAGHASLSEMTRIYVPRVEFAILLGLAQVPFLWGLIRIIRRRDHFILAPTAAYPEAVRSRD